MQDKITENVSRIREAVASATVAAGRQPSEVSILAATKYTDRAGVESLLGAGIELIGENRVQDASRKLCESPDGAQRDIRADFPDCRVHMIGHLQANKINQALRVFDLIETVDSVPLAEAIEKRLDRILPVLIEVRLTGEKSKSGCSLDELPVLLDCIWTGCPHLAIKGMMGMGPWDPDPEVARPFYRELKGVFDKYRSEAPVPDDFSVVSMGMSADFHVAIQEGATLVRIGRAFFE